MRGRTSLQWYAQLECGSVHRMAEDVLDAVARDDRRPKQKLQVLNLPQYPGRSALQSVPEVPICPRTR